MQFTPKRLAASAAALAMVAAPVAASAAPAPANPAARLSVARASSATGPDSQIAEGGTATLVNIGILAALVVVVLLATTGGDDDTPDSP